VPRPTHIHEDASPVSVSQAGLIRLNGPARAIALDVLRESDESALPLVEERLRTYALFDGPDYRRDGSGQR